VSLLLLLLLLPLPLLLLLILVTQQGLASCPDAPEFYAYSLLAAAGQEGRVLAFELASVPQQLLDHAYVQHALRVISALRSGQYLSYYAAYADAPRMAPYLLDHWLPRVRSGALRALLAAYHPTALPLAAVAAALGMDDVQEVGGRLYMWKAGGRGEWHRGFRTLMHTVGDILAIAWDHRQARKGLWQPARATYILAG
jgi:hypothetical protein